MRLGVFFLNWEEIGGGTAVPILAAAELARRHAVVIRTVVPVDRHRCEQLFGVDLSAVELEVVAWDGDRAAALTDADRQHLAALAAREVDGLLVTVDHSPIPCLAPRGALYVHFPGVLSGDPAILSADRSAVASFDAVLTNSSYTATATRDTWGVDPAVLHPPVDPVPVDGAATRDDVAITLGRLVRPKRHLEAALAGERLRSLVPSFRHLAVGSADPTTDAYAAALGAFGSSVRRDVERAELTALLASAKLLWHPRGITEPLHDRAVFEHFGMAIAEAMAAGCVPLIFDGGGPAELVEHEVSGVRWRTLDELVERSRELLVDEAAWRSLSDGARRRAAELPDRTAFAATLEGHLVG